MKAAAFDYVRPQSLEEALALLGQTEAEPQAMAGGQSLVAMLNLRVAAPGLVVDIGRLAELRAVTEDERSVTMGACVTHAAIEDGAVPDPSRGLMPAVAAGLAYRAIRTRGTIGGSLALADPAAEWPSVLAALDAEALLRGRGGERTVPCAEFVTGIYATRLAPAELIRAIRIPRLSVGARWGFQKFARKSGEFAHSLAVAVRDGARGFARVVLGAANGAPLVLPRTSAALMDGRADGTALAADLDSASDRHFDEYQREVHEVIALRAIRQAIA